MTFKWTPCVKGLIQTLKLSSFVTDLISCFIANLWSTGSETSIAKRHYIKIVNQKVLLWQTIFLTLRVVDLSCLVFYNFLVPS